MSNRDVVDEIKRDLLAFYVAGATQFMKRIIAITINGGSSAPAAAFKTGQLRSSPRVTVNSLSEEVTERGTSFTMPTPQDIARAVQLQGFRPGDTLMAKWTAAHANIIEGGRRMGSHGRMLGSEQNPDGFLHLAIDEAQIEMDSWHYTKGKGVEAD